MYLQYNITSSKIIGPRRKKYVPTYVQHMHVTLHYEDKNINDNYCAAYNMGEYC